MNRGARTRSAKANVVNTKNNVVAAANVVAGCTHASTSRIVSLGIFSRLYGDFMVVLKMSS